MRLLLTDADNTLWDTNDVYARAQLRLLEKIEDYVGRSIESADRLGFVRAIDQNLALQHPRGLGYPPLLLSSAILRVGFERGSSTPLIGVALTGEFSSAIAERFANELSDEINNSAPELRPGVREALFDLKNAGVQVIVLTEGEEKRCVALLERHNLAGYVSGLKSTKKTATVYRALKSESNGPSYMVGDQLDVDVRLSRAAGITSIYFPSEFTPGWTSGLANDADFTIASYAEVPSLITTRLTAK